ncbi:uncharacterized protein LOC144315438 [Canis aureus]
MAPEADAIGETAQSGGAPAAAVCWLGAGGGGGGGGGSAELYDGAGSRRPNPRRLPLCGRTPGPPAGSAAPGLTTDSTPHQPPRPRALRSSAPHVTASACLRARPGGRGPLAPVPPSSPALRGAGQCACALGASRPLGARTVKGTGVDGGRSEAPWQRRGVHRGAGGRDPRSRLVPTAKLENRLLAAHYCLPSGNA